MYDSLSAEKPCSIGSGRSRITNVILSALFVIASSLMLSGCEPNEEAVSEAKSLIEKAQEHVENSEYADAMKKYEKAISLDASNEDAYVGIAEIYLAKSRSEDAQDILSEGLSKADDKDQIFEYLGELARDAGEEDDAITYFTRALSEDAEMYKSAYLLGLTYVEKGKFEKARDVLDISEDGGDWYAKSRLLSAVTYWEETDEARALLTEVVDDEDLDESVMSLVETYIEDLDRVDGLEEDAEEVYRDVILAHGALNSGFGDVVIDRLIGYAEDEEEYWDLLLYLGRAYAMEGEDDTAREYLESAVSKNPSDPFGPWYLARVYSRLGMDDEMQEMYVRAIALAETNDKIKLRKEYCDVLLANEQYEFFDEQLAILIQDDSENAIPYALLSSESLIDRELYDEAQLSLDEVDYASLPEEEKAQYAFLQARILFSQGKREEALDWAEDAVELSETVPEFHLLLGQLYYETGEEGHAQTSLERAIDLDLLGDVSAEAMKVLDRI